jgi:hypothetical protein
MSEVIQYETGATTLEANNLVLSVMNDSSTYQERMYIALRILKGRESILSYRDIAQIEAQQQRAYFGSKFKPQHITEAGKIIQEQSIESYIDTIRDHWNNQEKENHKPIVAYCRRWFDKINGNSYYSVSLDIDGHIINIPMSYGSGSQWQYDVLDLLEKLQIIAPLPVYPNGNKDYGYLSDYDFIRWIDQGYGLKKDMFKGLYI